MENERFTHKIESKVIIDPVIAAIFGLGLISGAVYWFNFKLEQFAPKFLILSDIYLYIYMALFLNLLYFVGARLVFKHLSRIGRCKELCLMIIGFGMVFRAVLVPGAPDLLSTDMYRYVWDGRVQQHGINPYLHAPEAEQLKTLRDDTIYPKINRKEHPTVYPAGAQILFRIFHFLVGDSTSGFKGLFVVSELLTMSIIVLTLRTYGFEDARVFIYAWNPLVIFEIGFSGHVDGLTVFFTVLAFYLGAKKKKIPAVASLAFASASKLYPALLLPTLLNRGERTMGTIAFLVFFFLLYLPFFAVGNKVIGFLPIYFTDPFENFNLGLKYLIMDLFPGLDYVVISKVFILTLMAAGSMVFFKEKRALQGMRNAYILIGMLIVLMPTAVHPWYVIMLIPFLCFFPSLAWLLFTCLVTVSYIYYEPLSDIPPVLVSLLEYLPLFIILTIEFVLKRPALHPQAGGLAVIRDEIK